MGLHLARLGLALVLEKGEARVAVIRQLIGVEAPVPVDAAAGKVLAHQPEQSHRAGSVGNAEHLGGLGGVGLTDVREVDEQILLRHESTPERGRRGPPRDPRRAPFPGTRIRRRLHKNKKPWAENPRPSSVREARRSTAPNKIYFMGQSPS